MNKTKNTQINEFTEIISNDISLHYYAVGSGYPLFVINGYGVTANFWARPFVDKLAETYTVYLINYPSINSNYSKDSISIEDIVGAIVKLAQKLGYSKFDMIGWSMGSAIATALAINYNSFVRSLLLIAFVTPLLYVSPGVSEGEVSMSSDTDDLKHKTFFLNIHEYKKEQYDHYFNQSIFPGTTIFSNKISNGLLLNALNRWKDVADNYAKFKQLETPILFMFPQYEMVLKKQLQLEVINSYTGYCELHELPNCGHAPFYQQADFMVNLINNFIGRLPC